MLKKTITICLLFYICPVSAQSHKITPITYSQFVKNVADYVRGGGTHSFLYSYICIEGNGCEKQIFSLISYRQTTRFSECLGDFECDSLFAEQTEKMLRKDTFYLSKKYGDNVYRFPITEEDINDCLSGLTFEEVRREYFDEDGFLIKKYSFNEELTVFAYMLLHSVEVRDNGYSGYWHLCEKK